MTGRLASVAQVVVLLDPHQCGSLTGLSTSDLSTTLIHEVKTLQMAKRKVSTLFLDIKGGFHNVNATQLCRMLGSSGGLTPTWYPEPVLS